MIYLLMACGLVLAFLLKWLDETINSHAPIPDSQFSRRQPRLLTLLGRCLYPLMNLVERY